MPYHRTLWGDQYIFDPSLPNESLRSYNPTETFSTKYSCKTRFRVSIFSKTHELQHLLTISIMSWSSVSTACSKINDYRRLLVPAKPLTHQYLLCLSKTHARPASTVIQQNTWIPASTKDFGFHVLIRSFVTQQPFPTMRVLASLWTRDVSHFDKVWRTRILCTTSPRVIQPPSHVSSLIY